MAKKNKEVVNPVGRPPENKPAKDTAKGHMVSLTPNERELIEAKHKSLTLALKSLIK